MSTLPPDHRNAMMRSTGNTVNMAAPQSSKAKSASKASNGKPKSKTQMHRRSRTGCYTCRLRRKKCDEGSPMCTACKHLGLQCEYKRPMWWSNNDMRRRHKDDIKTIIKRKKLSEKSSHNLPTSVGSSPPGLSHSLPTSATFTDPLDRTRSASIDSHFSAAFNFNSPPSGAEYGSFNASMHPEIMFGSYSPYEIDVKTERQMFVNDVPTLRESTISTFSTYQPPPPAGTILSSVPFDGEWAEQIFQERKESLSEETLNINFFDFSHGPSTDTRQIQIELDENDQRLLEHFIQFVLPTIFPILESNQHGSVSSDLILPALQSNSAYLHCCLSIAAQHLKSHANVTGEEVDQDIMRHRYATIWALCEALKKDENHQQILEATLGLIFFQCVVGRFDDGLLDIPWHQHFQAAISLVQKLDLPRIVSDPTENATQTPFNMTLTSWIDILGATMKGRSPTFAHAYREKHLSQVNPHLGLRELMGCDDRVMYLISEIACLESLKKDGMDDFTLCQHVSALGEQISLTEMNETGPKMPFNANGSLSPKQLSKNMTAAFRLAARIYLCSLVPGFGPTQPSHLALIEKLTAVLQHIPSGPNGFDRNLVWVYLIGGSVSLPGSNFRAFFHDRLAQLGDLANYGSMGRVATLLHEVWLQNDNMSGVSTPGSTASEMVQPHIHWRDVMQMKGWDFLLI
ncbi:fungal-specific transcription factor domain-containing protein [Ilyonectria robusta]|uniref:fungal-specific transcription factor domain-containing protein n=1 Tax=Ilyonectria robusta TaxID=1079257 RepID=UPI001E8CC0C1|nr:fungal-specific transcription factor domain-containing protein [Ilyonectria robusta]KAH8737481.1 fungal-specific transcription factor domain-containing protein [Ilyonectria robusta]